MIDLSPLERWTPGAAVATISSVDAHTGGEPFRVVTAGIDPPSGVTMLEKRRYAARHLDGVRRALMWEPRGHSDMYGCLLTEPVTEGADIGVLFMHNDGFSTMCGHGIIALVTVLHETGCLPDDGVREIRIDTPAGLVRATAHRAGRRLERVSFENVPSFVAVAGGEVNVTGVGRVRYDLAFGGAFYAFVDAAEAGLSLVESPIARIVERGMAIKRAVATATPPRHPADEDLSFLYGTIFTSPVVREGIDSRHVCVFAAGEVDRSPTGTGVSARVALFHASGTLPADRPVRIESITGAVFEGSVLGEASVGPFDAIVPSVSGRAWICGRNTWVIDREDPFGSGFLLR